MIRIVSFENKLIIGPKLKVISPHADRVNHKLNTEAQLPCRRGGAGRPLLDYKLNRLAPLKTKFLTLL